MKLEIELVPSTSWYSNVRSEVKASVWDKIRKQCYKLAGNVCEVCGKSGLQQGRKHAVECHEIWEYSTDTVAHYQVLKGFIALCPVCHELKHVGRTIEVKGEAYAINKLAAVNKLTKPDALKQIDEAFALWQQRSRFQWTVDISYMNTYL